MDGEAGWWTTSGNIGLPPLARVMGVGRQQQARHVKLCQMTRKMDKVFLGYMFFFYLGREINPHNWIWGLYSSVMVKCYMHPTVHQQREVFEGNIIFEIAKF